MDETTRVTITLEFSGKVLIKATNDKGLVGIEVPCECIEDLYNQKGGVRDLGLTAIIDDQGQALSGDCYTYVRIGGKWIKFPIACPTS